MRSKIKVFGAENLRTLRDVSFDGDIFGAILICICNMYVSIYQSNIYGWDNLHL